MNSIDDNRYAPRPQPRHLKPRVARPEPVAAPRKPEHAALIARYDAGELSAVALLEAWGPAWDAARLREAKAEAVATAVLLLGVSL